MNEPNKNLCRNVKMRSYQVQEKAGIVWVFMGSGEPPALPKFPWIDLPQDQFLATVWLQETNWFQGAEGEIDSSHVSCLHRTNANATSTRVHRHYTYSDPSPKYFIRDTNAGFMSIARRNADNEFYWRITQWMAPMFSLIPSAAWPIGGRAWIPIDNENTYCWDFSYSKDQPLQQPFLDFVAKGAAFPPEYEYKPHQLNTGSMIDTWIPRRRMDNNYLIDRELQQTFSTTGIYGVNDQDRAMQEGMGRIADRSKEMLISSDIAIVTARRRVLDILEAEGGIAKFRERIADGTAFAVDPVDVVLPMDGVDDFLAAQGLA
jgi:phthalate 4,5-dioxygenase oxygenase subunit